MSKDTEINLKDIDLKRVPKFFFESNQIVKWIETDEDFILLSKTYPEFYKAKANPKSGYEAYLEFGFRREHIGQLSLGEWLIKYKKEVAEKETLESVEEYLKQFYIRVYGEDILDQYAEWFILKLEGGYKKKTIRVIPMVSTDAIKMPEIFIDGVYWQVSFGKLKNEIKAIETKLNDKNPLVVEK